MINDYIYTLAASVIDLSFEIYAVLDASQNSGSIISNIINTVSTYLSPSVREMGQDLYMSELKSEIQKIVDTNIKGFVEVMEDKHFGTKAFISKAVDAKAIDRTTKGGYALKGGDEIGRTLQETVEFLESHKNQDIYLKIKAQIENSKK